VRWIIRLYDRNFALTFVSNLLFVTANTLLAHFARWVTFLDGDKRDIGWIMGVGAVSAVLLRAWIGGWIDRIGPRRTWAVGNCLFIVTTLGYLALDDLGPAIYLLRVVNVLATAIVFTSILVYMSHTVHPTRLVEAIGSMGAAGFMGMMIGPLTGGILLDGATRSYDDFVRLFGTVAGLAFLGLISLVLVRPVPPHPDAQQTAFFHYLQTVRRHWPGSILIISMTFGVCMAVPFGFLVEFIDAAGLEPIALGPLRINPMGTFFLIYASWGLFLRIILRRLPERIGRRRQVALGMVFMAAGMLCYPLVDHTRLLVLPALLCGTAHSLTFHTMTGLVMQSFPSELRGVGAALALMALDGGMVCGGPLLGQVAYYAGYSAMFTCIAAICSAAVVVFWITIPARKSADEQPTAELCPSTES
jgi:MFS family permease